jgi:hypothetical protein
MSFRITGLPAKPFDELFSLSDEALASRRAMRVVVDREHGYPCRISLTDAEPGQTVVLLNYEHQPADSPFRSNYAIYIREGEQQYLTNCGGACYRCVASTSTACCATRMWRRARRWSR